MAANNNKETKRVGLTIDAKTYNQANKVFDQLGLSMSNGVAVYLHRVAETGGIPFTLTTKVDK